MKKSTYNNHNVKVSIKEIEDLSKGKKIDESYLELICTFIDERIDCSDFRLTVLLKMISAYKETLSIKTFNKIKDTVLNFKYWIDEPGEDSLCFWSENHQLLFHTCEYIAGNMFSGELFTNSNMTGASHIVKAKTKLLQWFEHKIKYGFIEWHSNTYYEEDIAPLALLIDHSPDKEIVDKATVVMDILLLDIAMYSYQGNFNTSSGRCYEGKKKDMFVQGTLGIYNYVFGDGSEELNYSRISSVFYLCKNYKVPQVILDIEKNYEPHILKESVGLNLSELKKEFNMKDMDCAGAFIWQMEAFMNPETVELTIDMFNKYKLQANGFLKDFNAINIKILRKLRLYPLIVKMLNPAAQGIAIQRSNNYTYKTEDYMLSTSMRHHPGKFADQHHIWHAALPNNINVFTTHPAKPKKENKELGNSPNYWVGNGIQPDSAQHENINMTIYNLQCRKGLLEKKRQLYTHAYFPKKKFDEVICESKAIFGRIESTYIALLSASELIWKDEEDVLQNGKNTAWVCYLGNNKTNSTFSNFVDEVNKHNLEFDGKNLIYNNLSLTFKKDFCVNKQEVSCEYPRYDTPYLKAERKPSEINISFNDKKLTLDFANGTRVEE